MNSSKVLIASCVALLLAGTAGANIGSFSFSHSVTDGSGQVDFTLTSSTYGATTTRGSSEALTNSVTLYNAYASSWDMEYDFRPFLTQYSTTGPPFGMRMVSNFSFSGLPPGVYSYFVSGGAWQRTPYTFTYYTTYPIPTTVTIYTSYFVRVEYSYDVGSAALAAVNVPTVGQFGLMLLGLALAASGVILLRRA